MSVLFAATYPERSRALVLVGAFAKRLRTDDYPWAPSLEERFATIEEVERDWGVGLDITDYAPHEDPALLEWYSTYLRRSASPGAAAALLRMNSQIDIRHVLPTIRVPTLVLARIGDRDVKVEEGRWIASQIPDASFVELPGDEHLIWAGDQVGMLAEIEEFLTGTRSVPEPDRVLSTVLFTDIVGSTERAASSVTAAGTTCSTSITRVFEACSSGSAAERWTRRATASSPVSTGLPAPFGPRVRSVKAWRRSGSRSARDSTPVNVS